MDRAVVRAMAGIIACDIHPLNNTRVGRKLNKMGIDKGGILDWTQGWIRDGFDVLEPMVEKHGGQFAFGDSPTLADCCLIPQVYSAVRYEVDLTPYPHLKGVAERANAHPAFAAAHPNRQPDAKPL
jgi:maleylacetoacetate isomerase/maleylpyruvate isomerase